MHFDVCIYHITIIQIKVSNILIDFSPLPISPISFLLLSLKKMLNFAQVP